jgi:cyclic pyranopterin phosphate synthase
MPEDARFLAQDKLLTRDELIKIAEIFVYGFGIKKIRFTGGEPLLRNDADEIIKSVSRLPVELAITTNGVLLDKYLLLFKKIGLPSVNVSLDSLMPLRFEQITKRSNFHIVKRNIDRAIEDGFNIKINMVVSKDVNDAEVLNFAKWTLDTPVHIRFIEFMPFIGNNWKWGKVISSKEIKERIENLFTLEKLVDKPNATAKSFRIKGAIGTLAFISTVTEPFCESCNRLRLTAEGKLQNCLFARSEVDLLSTLRKGNSIEDLIIANVRSKVAFQGGESPCNKTTDKSMVSIGG